MERTRTVFAAPVSQHCDSVTRRRLQLTLLTKHFSVTVTVTVLFAKPIKLTTIRKNVGLPSDVAFHRSMDHIFAQNLDTFSEILPVTNKLLNFFAATVDQSLVKGKLEGQDDVVDNFHSLVVDSMDQLLDKTVSLIDVPFLFNSRNYLLI